MLEELFSIEELEIGILDPAITQRLITQARPASPEHA
jgi:hypothetical protein